MVTLAGKLQTKLIAIISLKIKTLYGIDIDDTDFNAKKNDVPFGIYYNTATNLVAPYA